MKSKYSEALFQTWKQSEMATNEDIQAAFKEIASRYNHKYQKGFYITRNRKNYEEKYAEAIWSGWEFSISTVSSSWTAEEATIFMKQLKEATECVSELNIFIKSLDYKLKRQFEKEMEERENATKVQ